MHLRAPWLTQRGPYGVFLTWGSDGRPSFVPEASARPRPLIFLKYRLAHFVQTLRKRTFLPTAGDIMCKLALAEAIQVPSGRLRLEPRIAVHKHVTAA